jgi:hypothetical protein
MTTIRVAEDESTRLRRRADAQGLPPLSSPADVQAFADGITTLAQAKAAIVRLAISVSALRTQIKMMSR